MHDNKSIFEDFFSQHAQHGHRMHFRHGRHGFPGGFGHGFGRFGGRGRGDLKFEILSVLAEGPRHGYDIMLAIEARRGGVRPSPGSIYPALQMLEDAEYVRGEERDGKRTYTILDKGRELLAERPQHDDASGASMDNDNLVAIFAEAMRQIHGVKDAAKQIAKSGNLELIKRAVAVLDKTRRELFAILADDM